MRTRTVLLTLACLCTLVGACAKSEPGVRLRNDLPAYSHATGRMPLAVGDSLGEAVFNSDRALAARGLTTSTTYTSVPDSGN